MKDAFELVDDLGPEKIVYINKASAGLRAIVVIDNTATGISIGGVRMAPDVSLEECQRLARAMTLKNASADLPHGGGKAVIFADPAMPRTNKETLIRAFAKAIDQLTDYVAGPDMGTDEQCMGWIRDEIGRAVGLPRVIGGIPLDEIGATGFGLAIAGEAAQAFGELKLDGARMAVQGYGAVGRHAARFLAERGVRLVAASDSKACISNASGLDPAELEKIKARGGSFTEFQGASTLSRDAIIAADCDILIPAARPDVINEANVDAVRAQLILEGANIPATAEAERRLHERGILVVPDFVANAGGVICASVEYHGGSEAQAFAAIEEKIRRNTIAVLHRAQIERITPRQAAYALAMDKIQQAQKLKRFR